MKKIVSVLFLVFVIFLMQCNSTQKTDSGQAQGEGTPLPNPFGESEPILNEKGETVTCNTKEREIFCAKPTDPNEFFRVYITSSSYELRQIKGTAKIQREVDLEADKILQEELKPFDLINFIDDGIITLQINPVTAKIETVKFNTRVPRLNDLAKILQNDATRWKLKHLVTDLNTSVRTFNIYYQIRLRTTMTRDEIKEMLIKENKKKR